MKKIYALLLVMCSLGTVLHAQFNYTGKPMYKVVTTRGGVALGTFTVELYPNIAYKHVRNFDSLVAVQFFDSLAFHRCVPGFVIQGGSPYSKNGPVSMWGQSPSSLTAVPAEFTTAQQKRGTFAAARSSNINSATSQFYINLAYNASLDNNYTLYGRVTNNLWVVDTIVNSPKMATAPSTYSSVPSPKIIMFITRIGSNDTVPLAPQLTSPINYTVNLDSSKALSLKWNTVSDAVLYQLQVSRDSTFQTDTVQLTTTPLTSVSCAKRAGNTWYFWRVRTNNGGHYSPWSTVFRFHTFGETTGLLAEQPANFHFYPSPTKDELHVALEEAGSLLRVYDLQGKVVFENLCTTSTTTLSLKRLPNAAYTLYVQGPSGKITQVKFIKSE